MYSFLCQWRYCLRPDGDCVAACLWSKPSELVFYCTHGLEGVRSLVKKPWRGFHLYLTSGTARTVVSPFSMGYFRGMWLTFIPSWGVGTHHPLWWSWEPKWGLEVWRSWRRRCSPKRVLKRLNLSHNSVWKWGSCRHTFIVQVTKWVKREINGTVFDPLNYDWNICNDSRPVLL